MSIWSCVEYFDIFKMAAILSSLQIFFTGSDTGSWIFYNESHKHLWHFELLIDALAKILTGLLQLKFWLIWSSDDVMSDVIHNYLYTHIHNPMVHIYTMCNGDFSVICSVIMKKVHFSFIREYIGTISKSSCDVIDDVIAMKIFFLA